MSQRWRLTIARGPVGADAPHRELATKWEAIAEVLRAAAGPHGPSGPVEDDDVERSRPADQTEPSRARVQFAAPLPTGMTADKELIDILLPGRLSLPDLRSTVLPRLPAGQRLIEAHDIWISSASLPSLVIGADYRAVVSGAPAQAIDAAIASLFAAAEIPRPGREGGPAAANLRPLVEALSVGPPGDAWPGETPPDGAILHMRLRVDASLGSGRPAEVVAALATFGAPLTLHAVHRAAFCLRDEPRPSAPQPHTSRSRLRPVRRLRP